jgi:hypothetical protein
MNVWVASPLQSGQHTIGKDPRQTAGSSHAWIDLIVLVQHYTLLAVNAKKDPSFQVFSADTKNRFRQHVVAKE